MSMNAAEPRLGSAVLFWRRPNEIEDNDGGTDIDHH